MDSPRDLDISVGVPEKHVTTMETYISFKITTKTSRGGDFPLGEYEVRRRYSDFVWLRQKLEDDNPTHLIPPLPEKHTLTKLDRFAAEFLFHRQRALQIFLVRIASHPALSFNKNFSVFLTAKPWELQALRKEAPGIISRVNESLQTKTAPLMLGGRGRRDPRFDSMSDFTSALRTNLSSIDKVAIKLIAALSGHHEGLSEMAPLMRLVASSEEETELQHSFKSLADSIQCEQSCIDLLIKECKSFMELGLHEYILYTASIQAVLSKRDAIQLEYENTMHELRRKKEELKSLGVSVETDSVPLATDVLEDFSSSAAPASPSFFDSLMGKDAETSRRDKIKRLSGQVAECSRLQSARSDRTSRADADLKADMERWQADRKTDFVGMVSKVAERKVDYHRKCLSSWEATLSSFRSLGVGPADSKLVSLSATSPSKTEMGTINGSSSLASNDASDC